VSCVALTTLTPVAAVPPTVTVALASKPVPLIVMAVPPAAGPEVGLSALTVGGATYVNWSPGFVALGCPLTVTTTSKVPAACTGVVAVTWVALTTLTPVAAVPPTVTVAPAAKFVPVIVMTVPPDAGPDVGLTAPTVGGTTYVNWSAALGALDWTPTVTTTSATPAACAGVVAVSCVALTTLTPVAGVPPTVTVALASKAVPVIVMVVPPAVDPEVGLTPVTVGGGGPAGQFANLKVPMRVCQFQVPFAVRYSFAYQNVQSSTGSTNIEL
jgi:hypothetical protein